MANDIADQAAAGNANTFQGTLGAEVPIHSGWEAWNKPMSKCDFCEKQRRGMVQRCITCQLSICRDCCLQGRLQGQTRHSIDVYAVDWDAPSQQRARKPKTAKPGRVRGSGRKARGVVPFRLATTRDVTGSPTPSTQLTPLRSGSGSGSGSGSTATIPESVGHGQTRTLENYYTPSPHQATDTVMADSTILEPPDGPDDDNRPTQQIHALNQGHLAHATYQVPPSPATSLATGHEERVFVRASGAAAFGRPRVNSLSSPRPRIRRRPTPYPRESRALASRSRPGYSRDSTTQLHLHQQGFYHSPVSRHSATSLPSALNLNRGSSGNESTETTPRCAEQTAYRQSRSYQPSPVYKTGPSRQPTSSLCYTVEPSINGYNPSWYRHDFVTVRNSPMFQASHEQHTPRPLQALPNLVPSVGQNEHAQARSNTLPRITHEEHPLKVRVYQFAASLEFDSRTTQQEYPSWPLDACLRHEVSRAWSRGSVRQLAASTDESHAFHVLLSATYIASIRLNLEKQNLAREWLCEQEDYLCEAGDMEPLRVTAQRAYRQ